METLKEIDGFRKEYRVSQTGNIFGIHGKLLKQKIKNKRHEIGLRDKYNRQKVVQVSRIVAKAFCKIPEHLLGFDLDELHVHHIDHNPHNNNYTNLLWVTEEEHEKLHENDIIPHTSKCVAQIKGNVIVGLYSSLSEAATKTGIPIQLISDVVSGVGRKVKGKNGKYFIKIRHTAGGYKWTNKLEGDYIISLL